LLLISFLNFDGVLLIFVGLYVLKDLLFVIYAKFSLILLLGIKLANYLED